MGEAAVAPVHYRLELDLQPDGETFRGGVAITLALAQAAAQVRLDCVELDIKDVKIDGAPATWHLEGEALVVTPASPLQPGRALVSIRYCGRLQTAPRGLYRTGTLLATQMQPTHARRVFPCFDDPRFRSVFELAVQVPQGQTAISNASVRSPAIPTYLLALAVGDFRKRADPREDPPIALYTVQDPERCGFALRMARKTLEFQAAWLGRAYPFEKLDLVALPRTGVAGMENTAAIFIAESAVAIGEQAPVEARADTASLLAHEIAHQWFGGLVTPRNWQDLWLSEGFATWMAAKTLCAIAPALAREADEVRAVRSALHADFGPGARALVRGGESQGEIEELFDGTAYRKGAALLRMLEAWVGETALRRGLQLYLDRHAGATATSEDLWQALESACGKQVADLGRSFATSAGAPHLAVAWQGNTVEVTQLGEAPSSVPVHLRVALQDGEQLTKTLFLEGPYARITLPSRIAWVMGDAGAVGWYRCSYGAARPPIAALSPCEAVVLIEDAWLALWSGEIDLLSYLACMREATTAGAAAASVRAHAQELRDLLASGGRGALFDRWAGDASPAGAAGLDKQLALFDDPALDEPARVRLAEELLAHPATRHACWARIKERWDELGEQLVGLGGRGIIAGLAAFSDAASEKDITDFFARHEVPGARRMLQATLARIAGRRQFRERHQAAMDAFLLRLGAPAGEAAERVRIEHGLFAAMAAGFRGALVQRSLHDGFGLPVAAWMHTPENLRGALAAAERQLAALHRGVQVLVPGDVQLAQRLRDDLRAAADELERCEASLAIAAGFARCAATVERELDARVVFSALFDSPGRAEELRKEFAEAQATFAPAHHWIAQAQSCEGDSLSPFALRNDAVLAPGILRLLADRIHRQLAALGVAPPTDPSAAWTAFGLDAHAARAWADAGFDDAQTAAAWRLRGFDPPTARRLREQGADPAALRKRPAMRADPHTRCVLLPDGVAFTVEVADDAATRVQGLMHRDLIPARGGMLFVYADERPRPVTMRNVRIPLDVVWLRADRTVVHLEQEVPPWRDAPVPQDPELARCRFVLELPAGSVRRHGVEIGARLALGAP